MDILMLSDVYFPRVNGVSTSIRTFARTLVAQGHRVALVAPDYGPESGQAAHDGDFEVLRLPSRKIFFDPEDRLIDRAALRVVEPQLAARSWDVIHIHTPFRAHALGVRLARRTGRPTVETYHTYFEEYVAHYLPWLPPALTRWAARAASRRLCHGVDHLIAPSAQMVDVLRRYGIDTPVTVAGTGLLLDEFAGGDGERFRVLHGIGKRPTLVTVSRLAVEKNIAFLLRVAERLVAEFPDLLLLIAGEGPDAPRLRALADELGLHDNVRFFGNLDRRTELLDCYRAGDVFVFASPTETQGLVLIEAMALGVPIVSTAVMGTADVLRDARSAVISEEEDVGGFAAHAAALLRSPERRAQLAAAGPSDAQAWSAETLMQPVIELYARLASRDGVADDGASTLSLPVRG